MDSIQVERPMPGVAVLRLNRPEKKNALDPDTLFTGLPGALAGLAGDDSVSVVVLTGTGGAFSSGADVNSEVFQVSDPAVIEDNVRRSHSSVAILRSMAKPTIAAIDGVAVGFGFGLALACDLRFVSATAKFAAPFIRFGLPSDSGLSFLLPEIVGTARAIDLLLTGRVVAAEEAVTMGLAERVSEDALADALALASTLAGQSLAAMADMRRLVYGGQDRGFEVAVMQDEPRAVAERLASDEFQKRFAEYRARM